MDVFRLRYRRPSVADPLNWTDYRWEAGPWRPGVAAPFRRRRSRAGHSFALLLLAGLAALLIPTLLQRVQTRTTSWVQRGVFALVLLLIVRAFLRRRRW